MSLHLSHGRLGFRAREAIQNDTDQDDHKYRDFKSDIANIKN